MRGAREQVWLHGIGRRALLQATAALPVLARPRLAWAAGEPHEGPGFPRLMGMNIGAKRYHDPAYQAELARYHVVILDFFPGWRQGHGRDPIGEAVRAIKALNPAIHIAQYTNFNEAPDTFRDKTDKLNAANWWLRDSRGERVQWTSQYGAHDVNITEWAQPDDEGRRYPQWLAERDYRLFHQRLPEIDCWYLDNSLSKPMVRQADWRGQGREQPSSDAAVARAYRRGHVAGWQRIRALQPKAWLIANSDDVTNDEYRGQLEGVFMEALFGKPWSLGTWAGWDKVMQRYRRSLTAVRGPRLVGFGVVGGVADYRLLRFTLASCLLDDGYFAYSSRDNQYSTAPWFDEFDADLGLPVEVPPVEAWRDGVYRRRFQRGIALVNPSSIARTVEIGDGYRHLRGRQAPEVNTGEAARRVHLPPGDGLILVREA